MPKVDVPDAQDLFDLADLTDTETDPEEDLDLEAYLDLDESPEITRLMQELRGGHGAPDAPGVEARSRRPAAPTPRPEAKAGTARPLGAAREPASEALPEPPSPPARGARSGGRLDLAAVARALGRVSVQARQLVADCPRCGRAAIVVYADRFKCFGCDAAGDERALAAHLTGWDQRRVDAWLEAAYASSETDEVDVRRPWRLSFFAR